MYLKDIAKVRDTIKEKTSISRYNAKESVSIVIRKQSGANALNVVKGVKKEIQKVLSEKLPQGINIQVTYDQSQFIQAALSNVRDAAVQGGVLSFLVLLLFLWELKSALIIITAIPISITATAALMYFANISLNTMSLGGLALGVGMVVDNANIVIENIFRYRQQLGKDVEESAINGTSEMIPAIIGSTLTNIAVFLPFAFVIGVVGQIFKQLSFTISFSLITSIVVAVSLVPVLYMIAGSAKREEKIIEKVMEVTNKYTERFKNILSFLLKRKGLIVLIISLLFGFSLLALSRQDKQFMPKVDQRQFIIKAELSPGTRLEITDGVVKKIEALLLKIPETNDVTVNIGSSEEKGSAEETAIQTLGSHQAQILVNLKKKSKKLNITRSTDDVIQYLKTNLERQDLEGAEIEYVAQETSFGTALEQGAPIAIEIKGPNLDKLTDISASMQNNLNKIQGIYGIKTSMPRPSPETKLHVLKDKASLYGLSVRDVALTAQVALKGYVATKFKEKSSQEDIDIRVRLRPEDIGQLSNLRRLLIHSPLGADIAMSEVAYLTKGSGPTDIKRIDQQRSVMVTANTYKRNFNQIIAEVNKIVQSPELAKLKDYTIELAGEQQRMKESFHSLAFALVMAFVLVYMIMAAEFESLWQPFLIMFTVPLSLIGVAFSLFITRTPLNVVVYLGIIMLGGIAVNNGIVLIEFVNQLRKEGYSAQEAVLEASKTRLRPILMTSLTTILGLLPLALGIGEGAELQAPLALTVMGGLTSATFLTLVFIPALYLLVAEKIHPKSALEAKIKTQPQETKAKEEAKPVDKITLEEKIKAPEELKPRQELKHFQKIEPPQEVKPAREIKLEIIKPKILPPEFIPIAKQEAPPAQEEPPVQEAPLAQGELNSRQIEILENLKTLKKITRKQYADMFAISIPTAARDLKELLDKKLVNACGPLGPGRWYELK